jgi:hypothetical protein
MTHFKLLTRLERDLKNQVLFDSYRRPTRRTRLMIHWYDRLPLYIALTGLAAVWLLALAFAVRADPLPQCPNVGEPCKILFLSPQEEQMLMTKNGILDTAAQARAIDLGQFSVYLKTRIAAAPAGEVRKDESKPAEAPKEDKK